MIENFTSQSVREETNLAPRYKAICDKYLLMENALRKITDKATPVWKIEEIAKEALVFDPFK